MILGVIKNVDDNNGLKVLIDGETSTSTKKYSYLASYVPAVNDRVVIEEIGGSYVIIGKIVTEIEQSGIVRQADNATNADYANSAAYATSAQNAVNAANAENAANAALAAKATTALACSGNSDTATVAEKAQGIDWRCMTYESGKLVTGVTKQYVSDLGMSVVTDVSITYFTRNFVYK
jgi:hypothetical protein